MFKFFKKEKDFKMLFLKSSFIKSRFEDIMKLELFINRLIIDFTLDKELNIKDELFKNNIKYYRTLEWITDEGDLIDVNNIITIILRNIKVLYENKLDIDEFTFLEKELENFLEILEIEDVIKYKI